jgi:hypothetical protein
MKVVYIRWIDSETEIGWRENDIAHDHMDLCHSVGLLLAETHHYYILAHSYDPANQESNGRISIPKVSVKEMRTICQIKI